jgi:hypothetical protein
MPNADPRPPAERDALEQERTALARKRPATATKPRKAAPVLVATEHQEQSLLFQWSELAKGRTPELGLLFAIPNFSGRLGNMPPVAAIKQAQALNAEGRKKGVPDVMLPVPRGSYHGLFVEMKRVRGSTTSAEQRAWLDALRAQGYHAIRCLGWEQARQEIMTYLTTPIREHP